MASSVSSAPASRHEVIILGTGFAGLGMAIKLQAAGIENFVLLEKADEIGGTWRDNTYPGCACDIPSHLYSFSFEKYSGWSRMFPSQPEIWDYLLRVVEKYRLRPHIRFGAEALEARFDDEAGLWTVTTRDGRRFIARFLVSAMGGLSRPALPAIPGIERFKGVAFHSAQWRHDVDLTGKTVAVIGTGASAIQFVPQIAPRVGQLYLFQRTPPWILPKLDRPIQGMERWLIRYLPFYRWLFRQRIYLQYEMRALGFVVKPKFMKLMEKYGRDLLAAQVPDPALRAKLTPDYTLGCKRVLIANDYYPVLSRPNVELVDEGIAEITETGIVTRDGKQRTADVLIYGTGFRATDPLSPTRVYGSGGVELADAWREGAHAYYGMSVAGFPNFFMLVGPNTGLGHNSIVFMIEAQIRYVTQCIAAVRTRGARSIELRPEVERRFNHELQTRIARTVWASGCKSWYMDSHGKNVTLWPGFTVEYWWRTHRARLQDYIFAGATPHQGNA
jgi:cation diffusion facilitator CzcD-associated flavoprotein CzcO